MPVTTKHSHKALDCIVRGKLYESMTTKDGNAHEIPVGRDSPESPR